VIRKFILGAVVAFMSTSAMADCYTSGDITQRVGFKAVDAVDLETPETGLTGFTVHSSLGGATSQIWTTPTTNQLSAANQPGLYWLVLDEQMTISAGKDYEQLLLTISQAAMAPVDLAINVCKEKITAGETVTAASGNINSSIQSVATNAITAAGLAADVGPEIWATNCEDQNGGLSCAEAMSVLLSEAVGVCTYTSGTRTWVCSDPSGTETRFTMVYDVALDGSRTSSTPAPFTP
jgi:hypothetical protein